MIDSEFGPDSLMAAVRAFMDKQRGVAGRGPVRDSDFAAGERMALGKAAAVLASLASSLNWRRRDGGLGRIGFRVALVVEEVAELVEAVTRCPEPSAEIAVLDALADLLYVVVGAAVELDMSLDEAFWEVHRSNMTKGPTAFEVGPDGKKGGKSPKDAPGYLPPNLAPIIERRKKAAIFPDKTRDGR